MTVNIKEIASSFRPIDVIRALGLQGEERGTRFFALNPTRDDKTIGSFYIDLNTGYFTDKSTSDWGQDIVALWAYCRGMQQASAAKELIDTLKTKRLASPMARQEPRSKPNGELVIPAIVNANQRIPRDSLPGLPDDPIVYVYSGIDGISTLGLVYRWDMPDGKKEIRQRFMFVTDGGVPTWRWAGPSGDDNRPLYRLERLKPRPKQVWIVEGEKAADAGQALAPDGVAVISWLGGCSTADKVDVAHLRDLPCVLIPDRDAHRRRDGELFPYSKQPGVEAMSKLAAKLSAQGNRVSIVDYTPGDSSDGWDLADAADEGWTKEQVAEMVKSCSRILPTREQEIARPPGFGIKQLYDAINLNDFQLAGNGKPIDAWQSYDTMFHAYGITCRENEMTNKVEMVHVKTGRVITRNEVVSLCSFNNIPKNNADAHITHISSNDSYHPVVEWIKSKPWDGVSRVSAMFGTITVGESDIELSAKLFFRWCIAAVALATQERKDITGAPPAAQGVLVFTGGQGLKKSRWLQAFARHDFVRGGVQLDAENKDSLIKSTTKWIVEWAEIAGTKRPERLSAVKAHVTSESDSIRKHYGREAEDKPRRTVYIGTENNDDYLTDPTGNRRWWTIRVTHLQEEHGIDPQQFWAEIYEAFKAGAPWWLLPDEMAALSESNQKHEAVNTVEDLLLGALRWSEKERSWETASSLMAQLGRHCSSGDARRVVQYLERQGCEVDRSAKAVKVLCPTPRVLR